MLAKHSKSFSLIDCISVGVDRMQRNFGPMRKQVEAWQRSELTDVTAKVVIYQAFAEGKLERRSTWLAPCMIFTLNRGMTNSGRGPSGVSPARSLRPSRNWIPVVFFECRCSYFQLLFQFGNLVFVRLRPCACSDKHKL